MSLSKESADAFRHCLRILAPLCSADERGVMVRNVETYISEGKWIPALQLTHIARLFYPNDPQREKAMESAMLAAIERGELPNNLSAAGQHVFLSNDLAAWPECPPVPKNSPLRHWLPDWMQEAEQVSVEMQDKKSAVLEALTGKPRMMKRIALIAKLKDEGFSDPESAFRHSNVNGLRQAAGARKHGYWPVDETTSWFEQNQRRESHQKDIQAPYLGTYDQLRIKTHEAK